MQDSMAGNLPEALCCLLQVYSICQERTLSSSWEDTLHDEEYKSIPSLPLGRSHTALIDCQRTASRPLPCLCVTSLAGDRRLFHPRIAESPQLSTLSIAATSNMECTVAATPLVQTFVAALQTSLAPRPASQISPDMRACAFTLHRAASCMRTIDRKSVV